VLKLCLLIGPALAFLPACNGVFGLRSHDDCYALSADGTGCAVRVRAWGFCVDTNADAGVVIGAMDKTYFYPVAPEAGSGVAPPREVALPDLGKHPCDLVPQGKDDPRRHHVPVALTSQTGGVMINMNAQRVGVTVGYNTLSAIRVNAELDGVLIIDTSLLDPLVGRFHFNQKSPHKEQP